MNTLACIVSVCVLVGILSNPTLRAQAQQTQTVQQQFWSHWSDGKAEINHYAVTQSRYGEPRKADVFMIFVTEPFNVEKQVKADAPQANNPAYSTVLKLNRIKKFQTGIYDYSLMASVFVPVVPYSVEKTQFPAGAPIKVTFSSQEWCGMTFHQLNRAKSGFVSASRSYFERESDQQTTLQADGNTLLGDELWIAVRELIRPLPPSAAYFPTLEHARLAHKPLTASQVVVRRENAVPPLKRTFEGKSVEVQRVIVEAGDAEWTFVVEKQYPRRILSYQIREGATVLEKAELKTSIRLPYWSLNKSNDESYLKLFNLHRTR